MREKAGSVSEEGSLALDAPKLLEECQRQDFRVRELLERLVALGMRVEPPVGVVGETEKDDECLFQGRWGRSMLHLGHPRFLSLRVPMALFLPSIHATDI